MLSAAVERGVTLVYKSDSPGDVATEKHFTRPRERKIHMRDPYVSAAPLCSVCAGLPLTDIREEVTCGNCLRMLARRKKAEHI